MKMCNCTEQSIFIILIHLVFLLNFVRLYVSISCFSDVLHRRKEMLRDQRS